MAPETDGMGADAGADDSADADEAAELEVEELADRLGTDAVAYVDALNERIGTVLEATPGLRVDYVVGDVSDAFTSSSGHLHFDLVHEESSLHCVLFGYRIDAVEPELEDGLQVAVKGDLSYHEAEGEVSVIVRDVLELGEGRYERTYRENRTLLADDGLLAPEAKQSLPELPICVGIVTSAESDAREDAVTSIHGRYPDLDIIVQNASVQGDRAMESMMAAISALDDDARIDLIVLTRGGGADKHLRVFNETPLCRVVAETDTPIVVGVGHETDRTLAEEVADRRVMTPTHVGEIVPEKATLMESADDLDRRLEAAYLRTIGRQLREYEQSVETAYAERVAGKLDALCTDLNHAFEALAAQRLAGLESDLDHALAQCEQRHQFEAEKRDVAADYERSRRRQQIVIAILLVLLAGLVLYVLL